MIKSPDEIALMAVSGQLLAQVFNALDRLPLEGRSTLELNEFVERMIVDELDARPASKAVRFRVRTQRIHRRCGVPWRAIGR
ncbi:methionine aminopeptidase [Xanthomonas citri pv. punicae str. LMG 859]|nr:methionine aminopeptidase [Xanthomonas citri pv. punicae str. LMG 859]